jgi:hypothetical protein
MDDTEFHGYSFYAWNPTSDPDYDGWIFDPMDNSLNYQVDLTDTVVPFAMGPQIEVRFRFHSDAAGANGRGFKMDDLRIGDIIADPDDLDNDGDLFEDFYDPMDNTDNWCIEGLTFGQYWYHLPDCTWCTDFPALPINDALTWSTEITNAYEAYLSFQHEHSFGFYAEGRLELSADGGTTWFTLDVFTGTEPPWKTENYNLNFWVGSPILIRFRAIGGSPFSSGGHWCIKDVSITGKKDHYDPITTLAMSGTMKDTGWYNTPVQCTITATDIGAGMGDIHYILDGVENVVPGYSASFTINANGQHNLEYWGVDKVGNEELHHTVPTFRIDTGAAPTVAITAPEPGIYLFGKKLLGAGSPIIIGAFTIEANANDADSGVYRVQFYLDGDLIGEDTAAPYSAYCAVKHMGAGTIKVVAEDFAQNTAEDTLDIKYYKFL